MYVRHQPKDPSFSKVGIVGRIFDSTDLNESLNIVHVDTEHGHETTIRENESTFAYYVIKGSGFFEIEGEQENCSTGDLVIIPAGKKFTYKGKFELLLVNTPPWREEQEETF